MPIPPPAVPLVPGRPAWCHNIGRVIDYRNRTCHFGYLYECDLHGRCYLQHKADDPSVVDCQTCKDYEPQ